MAGLAISILYANCEKFYFGVLSPRHVVYTPLICIAQTVLKDDIIAARIMFCGNNQFEESRASLHRICKEAVEVDRPRFVPFFYASHRRFVY